MSTPPPDREWYFVCLRCDCKFFHRKPASLCPRCGAQLTSTEQLVPPWRPKLLKVDEAAKRLSISSSKTYQLIESGALPHHRIDGAIRVSEEQLSEYLNATKRERKEPSSPTNLPHRPRLRHMRL